MVKAKVSISTHGKRPAEWIAAVACRYSLEVALRSRLARPCDLLGEAGGTWTTTSTAVSSEVGVLRLALRVRVVGAASSMFAMKQRSCSRGDDTVACLLEKR